MATTEAAVADQLLLGDILMIHRRFVFLRDEDETGISGTGLVVMGVLYPDGRCHYRWMTEHQTDQMADSLDKLERIHGHNGRTRIVFLDDEAGQPLSNRLAQIRGLLRQQRVPTAEATARIPVPPWRPV
jgi:hypothetical protein